MREQSKKLSNKDFGQNEHFVSEFSVQSSTRTSKEQPICRNFSSTRDKREWMDHHEPRSHFSRPPLLRRRRFQARKQTVNASATSPASLFQTPFLLNPRSSILAVNFFSGTLPIIAANVTNRISSIAPFPLRRRRLPHPPNHPLSSHNPFRPPLAPPPPPSRRSRRSGGSARRGQKNFPARERAARPRATARTYGPMGILRRLPRFRLRFLGPPRSVTA